MEEIVKKENKENKRIAWIDYLKAIGIFLVVIGHSNPLASIRKWIYSFHMPLFFIVAGLTFNPERYNNTKEFVKHKAKTILLPYLMINLFTIPFYLWYFKILNYSSSASIIDIIKGIIIANNDIIVLVNGVTWFLPTLFLSNVLMYLIYKRFKDNKNNMLIISFILLILGYVEAITSRETLMIWHINSLPVCTFFALIGYICKDYIKIISNKKYSKLETFKNIVLGIVFIVLGFIIGVKLNGKVSFGGNNYKSIIMTVSTVLLTVSGMSIILMKIKSENIIMKLWGYIGRNTLIVLGVHKIIIYIFRYFIPEFKEVSLESTIIGVLVFIICIPAIYIINNFMPFLIGKFKNYNIVKSVMLCITIILIICFGVFYYNYFNLRDYKQTIENSSYIVHGLGGIDGQACTNSEEALQASYNNGLKLFKVDVEMTLDGKLVCVHGWSKTDYEDRLGMQYNEENSIKSYDELLSKKIKDKYTSMRFEDLVSFMEEHKDIYVMIDLGRKDYEETKQIYQEILKITDNRKILNRMITGRADKRND